MKKYCVIDFRMRKEEKEYIKSLGYELIENGFNSLVYDEISSHVDIYFTKVGNRVVIAPEKRGKLPVNSIVGGTYIENEYPGDVPYNVAIIGKRAIHNFEYTDKELKKYLETCEYKLINVNQGYTNCSIAVLDDNSCITTDLMIAKTLMDEDIDVIYVSEPEIKLLKRRTTLFSDPAKMTFDYSDMEGFIGGAMARLGDEVIIFGDITKFVNSEKIRKFIESKGLKIKDFPGLEIIDYGGILEVIEDE